MKDPWDRWSTFREIASQRARTDKPRGIAAMKDCLAIWLPSKEKMPGHALGLAETMIQLGQKSEAKALADRLPTLFPKKNNAVEVRKVRAPIFGYLRLYPLAEAEVGGIASSGDRRAVLVNLLETALRERDADAFYRMSAKVAASLPRDDAERRMFVGFVSGVRAAILIVDKKPDAAALQKAFATLEKHPDVKMSIKSVISLADSVLSARK